MNIGVIAMLVVFLLIFILKLPIGFGLMAAGASYFLFLGRDVGQVANHVMTTYYSNYVIIAVPLFIFTANIMNNGKITEKVFTFSKGIIAMFGGKKGAKGALAQVNILASLIFSGMTGSAIADAAGLGKMEIEEMNKEGYDPGFSCAVTAASATIGPIFPPSIPLVIYALFSGTSVGALFLAGMIPALFIALSLMIYVAVIAGIRNYPTSKAIKLNVFIVQTFKAIPAILTPVILLAGIYSGVMTPTEAGAVAALYAILVSVLIFRTLGFKSLLNIIRSTIVDTGTTSLMIGAASVISFIVAREGIANDLGEWLITLTNNKVSFLILVNVFILALGMFIDTSTIQLIFVPILIPVAVVLGVDLVHFGIVTTLNMMVGLSTPPFGMLLFITSSLSGTNLQKVVNEIWWPILAMIVVLILITFVPEIVLFLPKYFGFI